MFSLTILELVASISLFTTASTVAVLMLHLRRQQIAKSTPRPRHVLARTEK